MRLTKHECYVKQAAGEKRRKESISGRDNQSKTSVQIVSCRR